MSGEPANELTLTPEQTVLCHQMARLARLGGFVIDLGARRCLWCSDEVARIHGLSVAECSELLGGDARVSGSIHEEDRERYRQLVAQARRGRTPYTVEYRLHDARGDLLWLHESGDHLIDDAGGGERLVGSIRDVTGERRAEEELRQANRRLASVETERRAELESAKGKVEAADREARTSHERLLAAAEHLVDGIAIYDADHRLVFFNSRYPELAPPTFRAQIALGARFEDMVRAAEAAGGMYHPEMGAGFLERRIGRHRQQDTDAELRIADGRWMRVRESMLPDGGRVLLTSDITARRAARQALEEREERWHAVAEGVPLAIAIARLDEPEILFANALATELFGLTPGRRPEAIRGTWLRGADRRALLERLGREGRVDNQEVELRRTDGSAMWGLLSARTLSFGGRPAMLGAVTDITRQKTIEREFEASEARLAAIVDHAPVGLYVKDLEGRYVLANPEMGKLFGRPASEAIGHTAAEILPAPLAARIAEYDRRLLASGRHSVYERHQPDRAEYAWSMVIRFPIRDDRGRITHIGGFDVDISSHKTMEQALRASEQRFKVFAEAHPVPVVITRVDGRGVLFVSPPFLELFGIGAQALAGRGLAFVFADPAQRAPILERIRRDGEVRELELQLRRRDGSHFWGSFNARLIEYEGEAAVVGSVIDITDRKRAEAELERQQALLHQNEKLSALGSLLAGVAHELNNPLSVVVGHATLLEDLSDDSPTRDRAGKIRSAADRCARIVRSFLAMARSKPMAKAAIRLDETIDEALEIVAYGLRTADIQVIREYAPDLPRVWADGDQLHQVFANLLINAQQALQAVTEGPRRLRIATDVDAEGVSVEITDNGPGIPAEIAPRIFDPFFTTKPQGVGTGVGLSVCHGIVTAHGGDITFESRAGQGATFRVSLPRAAADAAAPEVERAATAVRGGRILVVDDEPDIGQLLADILERDGHRVVRALSGREALSRLAEQEVDLIISDLRMPDLDGPALHRELVGKRPELAARMLFVTGDTLAADITGFLSDSGAPVLEKPLDPADVGRKVQALLGGTAPSEV